MKLLAILAVSVIFAGLVSLGLATPALLLAMTFLLGARHDWRRSISGGDSR